MLAECDVLDVVLEFVALDGGDSVLYYAGLLFGR